MCQAQSPSGILFLTNNEQSITLYHWLKDYEKETPVTCMSDRLTLELIRQIQPGFIVSYNYKYIIPGDVLEYMNGRAVNLHVSFLPYNRGSSPNFFSFLDNTPKGVTIHEMTPALDKGRILCQKELHFDETKESFASSYDKLQLEICQLFKENWENIKHQRIEGFLPTEIGTYHTMKELNTFRESHPFSWNDCIADKKKEWGIL